MSTKITDEEMKALLQSDHGTAPAVKKCAEMPLYGEENKIVERPKPSESKPALRWVNPKHKGPPRPSIDHKYPRVRIIQAKDPKDMYSMQIKEKWWWLGWADWGIQKFPIHHAFVWGMYEDALREARRYRWDYHHPEADTSFCKEVR